jgi:hypothetical protein
LVPLLAHQLAISRLPGGWATSPVLRDFSLTPLPTGIELSQKYANTFINLPVESWFGVFEPSQSDVSHPVAAIVASLLTLVLDDEVVDEICVLLVKLFHNAPFSGKEVIDFLTNHYLPAFRNATVSIKSKLGLLQKFEIVRKGIGAFVKLLYATLFQETLFREKLLFNPEVNKVGAKLLPHVNALAHLLTDFDDSDMVVTDCASDVYPGAGWCRPEIPHAKWHESAANGYFDLVQLGDYLAHLYESLGDTKVSDLEILTATAISWTNHCGPACMWRYAAFGLAILLTASLVAFVKLYLELRSLRRVIVGAADGKGLKREPFMITSGFHVA